MQKHVVSSERTGNKMDCFKYLVQDLHTNKKINHASSAVQSAVCIIVHYQNGGLAISPLRMMKRCRFAAQMILKSLHNQHNFIKICKRKYNGYNYQVPENIFTNNSSISAFKCTSALLCYQLIFVYRQFYLAFFRDKLSLQNQKVCDVALQSLASHRIYRDAFAYVIVISKQSLRVALSVSGDELTEEQWVHLDTQRKQVQM